MKSKKFVINVRNQQGKFKINKAFIIKVSKTTLKNSKAPFSEIDLIFVNNKYIKKLNKKYLKRNRITDVIAFNYNKGIKFPNQDRLFGEIFVSIEQARKQAKLYNHSFDKEIAILVIHGILHLLGWNDRTKNQRKKMEEKIKKLLTNIYTS